MVISLRSPLLAALLPRIVRDEEGTATLEYALVLGMIILAAMALVANFGTHVIAKWNSVNTRM